MSKLVSKSRLKNDERRESIIRAALEVFSERGFHGTTTKALAQAAGVSEALLFRHFPTKNDLYAALQLACCKMKGDGGSEQILNLEPSTSSLVVLVHFLVAKMLTPHAESQREVIQLHRLMAHSYLEDGDFARSLMNDLAGELIAKIEASAKQAAKSGDMGENLGRADLRAWFAQHFTAMLMLNLLPSAAVVDFKANQRELIEQATRFALRGLGLKDDAIRRHYNPKAFALLAS